MADEIRQYTLVVPAGTTPEAPAVLDATMPPRNIEAIEIVIPPGVNGVVGFQIQNSGIAVIPYSSDDWIISNDEVINWPLGNYIDSGSWQLAAYNTGTNDHTLYFRFLCDYLTDATSTAGVQVISADSISGTDESSDALLAAEPADDDDSVDLSALAG